MTPSPVALSLTICDQIIVEERTRKVSLIGEFSRLRAPFFPSPLRPFCVFAVLVDGAGQGELELVVTRLETEEEVYAYPSTISFPDRFHQFRAMFRLVGCTFPAAGDYEFALLVDGEVVASRRLEVYHEEG